VHSLGLEAPRVSKKCIIAHKSKVTMVTGQDVPLEDIQSLYGKTLVGQFCGKIVRAPSFSQWVATNWKRMMGFASVFQVMVRGCLYVIFFTTDDVEAILQKY
jgi:hypothetical protein